jgi:hypothetical protein
MAKKAFTTGRAAASRRNRGDDLIRFMCFLVLSTAGMGAIGLALLAEPLKGYYSDRAFIREQERRIERMEGMYRQGEELLGNADEPWVVERAAVSNFKYVPLGEGGESTVLPGEWPDLKEALAGLDEDVSVEPTTTWEEWAGRLAEQPDRQLLLMAMGSALVVIGLACFYRLR